MDIGSRERFQVVVDHRERPAQVYRFLEAEGCEVTFDQLDTGDYLVENRLLFERKTLVDLVASMIDGRLFLQARRLASSSCIPVVVLEGGGGDVEGRRFSRESVQGALVSLTLVYGLPLLRSRDPEETARLIGYASRQVLSPRTRAWHVGRRHFKVKEKKQQALLQGLPGVGPVRSRALLQRFKGVQAVICASVEELVQVEGIGRITADQIRWLVE